jgi:hypothetical protein
MDKPKDRLDDSETNANVTLDSIIILIDTVSASFGFTLVMG